jgi:O-antigen ligase
MPEALQNPIVLAVIAVIALVILIGLLMLLKKLAMWLFTIGIVLVGAILLLLAVFGQQLGIWGDDQVTEAVQQSP